MAAERRPPLPRGLAVITVLKGMIGTGILGLPYVSSRVRLAVAGPGLLAAAVIGAFSVWRLLQCKAFLAERRNAGFAQRSGSSEAEDTDSTYGLGALAVVGRQAFGLAGVSVAAFGILASQLGFAVSYIDVIVETLSETSLLGSYLAAGSIRLLLCGMLACLCLLRRLSSLAWLSGAALLIYVYMLLALLYFGGSRMLAGESLPLEAAVLPVRWENFGSFLGTAIFAQEAIVISQYVYDEMQLDRPRDFLPVLLTSFGISGLLFTFVGVFGYICYGEDIKVVFYESFPKDSIAVRVGEVIMCIVLFFSYALQMYPVMSFLEAVVLGVTPASEGDVEFTELRSDYSGNESSEADAEAEAEADGAGPSFLWVALLRFATVAVTCMLACWVPNLACITGYSGSFAMSAIGFFMPPLCFARLKPGRLTSCETIGNVFLMSVGCAAVYFGIAATSC